MFTVTSFSGCKDIEIHNLVVEAIVWIVNETFQIFSHFNQIKRKPAHLANILQRNKRHD